MNDASTHENPAIAAENTEPGGAGNGAMATAHAGALLDAALETYWSAALAGDPLPTETLRIASTTSATFAPEPRVVAASEPEGAPCEYEVIRRIGEGGMGVVFEARQVALGRAVALKMMRPTLQDDPAARALFYAEASTMGVLEHPGIVTIFDAGVTDRGRPFYAMRLVKGESWSRIKSKLSLAENLEILEKVAEALACAHEHGIIHRDLKPANIFVDRDRNAWIGDWGLATRLADPLRAKGIDAEAVHGGTPAYLPPEMATGDGAATGVASDIYLLGGILHELLTGKPPHEASTAAAALRRATAPVALASPPKRPALARRAWSLMRRALSEKPEERPATALHFAGALALARGRESRGLSRAARWVLLALLLVGWGTAVALAVPTFSVWRKQRAEAARKDLVNRMAEEDMDALLLNQQIQQLARFADTLRERQNVLRASDHPEREALIAAYRNQEEHIRRLCGRPHNRCYADFRIMRNRGGPVRNMSVKQEVSSWPPRFRSA